MSPSEFSSDALKDLGVLTQDSSGAWCLAVHVQPGAKQTEFVGLHGDRAKIRVAAAPVDGKANKALVAWVAKALGVPKKHVEIVRGQSGRQKRLTIKGL